jgi:hypothetical protein
MSNSEIQNALNETAAHNRQQVDFVLKSTGTRHLLDLCQRVHELITGSDTHGTNAAQMAAVLNVLVSRNRLWHPSPDFTKPFDDAVRLVIQATIVEIKEYLAR